MGPWCDVPPTWNGPRVDGSAEIAMTNDFGAAAVFGTVPGSVLAGLGAAPQALVRIVAAESAVAAMRNPFLPSIGVSERARRSDRSGRLPRPPSSLGRRWGRPFP